jgi:hypothetical protein
MHWLLLCHVVKASHALQLLLLLLLLLPLLRLRDGVYF